MKNRALFMLIFGLLLADQAFGQSYTLLPIDVSCDAAAQYCPAGLAPGQVAAQTSAKGINARGDIVGAYVGSDSKTHGFLLKDGLASILAGVPLQFTSIDFPVAGVRGTSLSGINPQGEIVGTYTLPVNDTSHPYPEDSPLYCPSSTDPACNKSFYYSRGNFIPVMFTAPGNTHLGATVQSITPDGAIYGCLHDHNLTTSMYGAVWQRYNVKGGQQIIVPAFSLTAGGGQISDSMPVPMSMTNGGTPGGGTMVGFFADMSNITHGYIEQGGMLQQYDASPNANQTAIWGINPSQQFVGTYRLAGELTARRHGFVQFPPAQDGSLPAAITVDWPSAFATVVNSIDPDGVIVGQYTLSSGGALHGFVGMPPSATE